jgi:pimeloyl-ACP methyl ester carboxylesterase
VAQLSSTLDRSDGARLVYDVVGPSPAEVVFVHGWMTSGHVWQSLLPFLDGVGALVLDLRGAGRSSRGQAPFALSLLADDVRAVIDHAGLRRFHLVGHSMGGQVAQLVAAADARVRSLALLNPVPLAGLPLPDPIARSFRHAGGQRAAFDGILTAACLQLPDEARARLLDVALAIAPPVIAEGFDAFTRGCEAALEGVAAPAMVLATDDPFLPPQLLADAVVARLGRARLDRLPGPGHYPQVERPAETAARLRAFWEAA